MLLLSEYLIINGKKLLFWLTEARNLNICLHSDINETIWFKLGIVISTTELYILIQVCVNLTLFKVIVIRDS